jgi:hypothetical protein
MPDPCSYANTPMQAGGGMAAQAPDKNKFEWRRIALRRRYEL